MGLGAELRSVMTLCRSTPTRIMTTRMGINTQSRMALSRNRACSSAILSATRRSRMMVVPCDSRRLGLTERKGDVCAFALRCYVRASQSNGGNLTSSPGKKELITGPILLHIGILAHVPECRFRLSFSSLPAVYSTLLGQCI